MRSYRPVPYEEKVFSGVVDGVLQKQKPMNVWNFSDVVLKDLNNILRREGHPSHLEDNVRNRKQNGPAMKWTVW